MSDTAEEIRSVLRQLLTAHGCDLAINAHVDVAVDAISNMMAERDSTIECLQAEVADAERYTEQVRHDAAQSWDRAQRQLAESREQARQSEMRASMARDTARRRAY